MSEDTALGRLHGVILLTGDLDRQREFYEKRLGLSASHAEGDWVVFAPQGAALALQRGAAGAPAELQLAITAYPLEDKLATALARGAKSEGEITQTPLCRMAIVRDPEGNRVQLVEPTRELAAGQWPALSHAIVNAAQFEETVAFYREVLGLKVAEEGEFWVVFDTGATRLAVHDRADLTTLMLHPDQGVTFAFEDGEFEAWAEELRERGVTFAAAPTEGSLGLQAEVEDGDGWYVVLHGPAPDEEFDEDLVSSYEDEYGDDDDHRGARRGGELAADPSKRGGFNPAKQARKQAAKTGGKSYEALQKGGSADTGGFQPRARTSFGPPRPFTPRPPGAGPSGPGAGGPSRPYTPRPSGPGGPGGPSRPSGPPRPGGPSRPFTPRPPRPDRDRS